MQTSRGIEIPDQEPHLGRRRSRVGDLAEQAAVPQDGDGGDAMVAAAGRLFRPPLLLFRRWCGCGEGWPQHNGTRLAGVLPCDPLAIEVPYW